MYCIYVYINRCVYFVSRMRSAVDDPVESPKDLLGFRIHCTRVLYTIGTSQL